MSEYGISNQGQLLLQAYLDGELGQQEAEVVERRLKDDRRWAAAEEEMRTMLGDIVAGFVEIDGDVRRSQVGSLPVKKPHSGKHRIVEEKPSPSASRSSFVIVGATETSREIIVVSGVTVERKIFAAEDRKIILEIATADTTEALDQWLAEPFTPSSGMSTLSRRLPNDVGLRITGEMPAKQLSALKLEVV